MNKYKNFIKTMPNNTKLLDVVKYLDEVGLKGWILSVVIVGDTESIYFFHRKIENE